MKGHRRHLDATFKSRIVLEALKEQKTVAQIASSYEVHPTQIFQWKKEVLEGLPKIFSAKKTGEPQDKEVSKLYEQIGRLQMELNWLQKKWSTLS
jgi:putative transposase